MDRRLLAGEQELIPCGGRDIRWRADKGGEYTSEAFKQFFLETGISQEFATTNTPQQNGVSKRVGRTLCSMVRCLLVDDGLPPKLWGELMLTAAYLYNRMPHSGLDMETPFKRLYGKEAKLSHLKIIGARAFVHIKNANSWNPSPGKERCAASARTKRSPVGSGTRKLEGW